MAEKRLQILDTAQIEQKIIRIAHQIHENFYTEKSIVVVGIEKSGMALAKKLVAVLEEIAEFKISLVSMPIDKQKPSHPIPAFESEAEGMKNKPVILVDDVLNSGRTLAYAFRHLLDISIKSMNTVVLVDRFHRKFPIRADYVGLTLSTNLKEHVSVEIGKKKMAAYLD